MQEYWQNYNAIITSPIYIIITLAICVMLIIAWWKVFQKAGIPGWHSIIPFLNTYDEFKIAFGNGWMFLLLLIPVVNLIIYIILEVKMSNAFGQGTGFAIGMILLPEVFYLILGFGSAQYVGPQK